MSLAWARSAASENGPETTDIAYALVEVEAVDDRLLGVLRQRLDPVHGVLDIGQRRIEIRPRLELHDDGADALHGL